MNPDRLPLLPPSAAVPAPPWHIDRWFGEPASLDALRGRVVVLHAFQMLCPGCVLHGLPQAARVHSAFDPADVAVIGLHSVFEHHEAMGPVSLAAFLHEYRVPFPVAVDAHASSNHIPQTMQAYGLRGTPSLVLIDREGRVRATAFGRPSDLAVGAAVATLVAESSREAAVIGEESAGGESVGGAGCGEAGCEVSGGGG